MGNSPVFGRKSQPYQTPAQPSEPAQPVGVSTQPAVAWPDDEVRDTVVRTNREAWGRHDSNWRGHLDNAAKARADLAEMNRQFDELRRKIDAANEYIAQQDHYAGQERKTRDGYGAALSALGAPAPAETFNVFEPAADAVQVPSERYAGQVPHGYCVHCKQPVWVDSDHVTHGFGPTCNPEDPESTVATLANPPQAEAVAS